MTCCFSPTERLVWLIVMISCICCISWFSVSPAAAAFQTVGELPAGAVITIGNINYVKLGDAGSSGPFMSLEKYSPKTLQSFTAADCASLPKCTALTGSSCIANGSTVTLTDERDGKIYRVRRFADGRCWMVDNLRYGGTGTDGCVGKSTFNGCGNGSTASDCGGTGASLYGTWTGSSGTSTNSLYGDCRDAAAGLTNTASPCYGNTACGYYYNWQAVMQNASAYYSNAYYGAPGNDNVGICPAGWTAPTSIANNLKTDFPALDLAMGGTGINRTSNLGNLDFYLNGGTFNSFLSGFCYIGGIGGQGSRGNFWTQSMTNLRYNSSVIYPSNGDYLYLGFALRCIKPRSLQEFSPVDCAALPMCTATTGTSCDTNGSTVSLVDDRDNKIYRVRRFADGKCWMINNLRYGGSSDACAGRTSSVGYGSATPTNRFGVGTYGDCRDAATAGNGTVSAPCLNSTVCGYYYNWQAVMQSSTAYFNGDVSPTPGNNGAGICPTGWHVPTSISNNLITDFPALDLAMGGTGLNRTSNLSNLNFYTTGGTFNADYFGCAFYNGEVSAQGSTNFTYSSSGLNATTAYDLVYSSSIINPSHTNTKQNLFVVRCVKDTAMAMQDFTSEDCAKLAMCTTSTTDCATNGSTITLIDNRDGKSYQVRRFADGKCWMIDNLRYGGDGTDGCVGKSAFNGGATSTTSGSGTGISVYGTWTNGTTTSTNSLYGDCRDASTGAASTSPCYGNTSCGYYYSWQAVMQTSDSYYTGTVSPTPGNNGAGLCPTGWHPPTSGSATAEFGALDKAMGGTGNNRSGDTTVLQNLSFYTTGGKFNSNFFGFCFNNGDGLNYQGVYGYFWGQNSNSNLSSFRLSYNSNSIDPVGRSFRYDGFAVRCVADDDG